MATSQNGYRAGDASTLATYVIAGESVRLRKGDPGWLLAHFATWFDQFVEPLHQPVLDEWGYAYRPIRGQSSGLSNHASGTAIDLNAQQHPLGEVGTFTAKQAAAIRAQLKIYDGCIRWGGDYHGRRDEMHFEINADEATCTRVASRLRQNQEDDDMPTADEIWHTKIGEKAIGDGGVWAEVALARVYQQVDELDSKVDRLTALVESLISKEK
jgi:hypothetical protein